MKIKTNSQEPGEPKETAGNTVFEIFSAIASEDETQTLAADYAEGIGWGDAKQRLFEMLDGVLAEPRERYNELMSNPEEIDKVLAVGGERARAISRPYMDQLRQAVGIA